MLETLIKATVLLIVVAIIAYALRRSSAAWRHLVWALGLFGIAAIPALTAFAPFRLPILPATMPVSASRTDAPARREARLQTTSEPVTSDAATTSTPVTVAPVDDPVAAPFDVRQLLVALWILGALGLIARFVVGLVIVRRVERRAQDVTDPAWIALRDRAARAFGIMQPIALRRSNDVAMPFACGLLKPSIILPVSADEWTVDRRQAVLMHEFAHISRGDLAMNLGSHLVRALYWFHPLAWLAAYRLRVEGERACDDAVLRAGARPSDYAEHLLSIVRSIGSTVPNVALAMARRSDFEGRLLAILEPGVSRATLSRWRAAAMAMLFLGAVLPLSAMVPSAASPVAPEQSRVNTESAKAPISTVATKASVALQQQPTAAMMERSQSQAGGAVGALIDALADANAAVRLAAVGSLGSLGDPRAIAALSKALKEDSDARVREAAAHALGEIDDVRAVPALVEALGRERAPNVREKIIHALGEIDDPSAIAGIAGAAKDANVAVRRAVAWALGEIDDPAAVPALISMAGDDDVEVRRYVAGALGELETPSAVEPLIALAKDPDAEVRSNAISSLSDLEDQRALPVYITALKDSNAEVRQQAASALGDLELKTAPAALIAALTDPDEDVRQQVAETLGDIGDEAAVPGLKKLIADPNKDVRHSAAESLAEIGGVEAIQALMGLLKDQDPEIRRIAAEALGKKRD